MNFEKLPTSWLIISSLVLIGISILFLKTFSTVPGGQLAKLNPSPKSVLAEEGKTVLKALQKELVVVAELAGDYSQEWRNDQQRYIPLDGYDFMVDVDCQAKYSTCYSSSRYNSYKLRILNNQTLTK